MVLEAGVDQIIRPPLGEQRAVGDQFRFRERLAAATLSDVGNTLVDSTIYERIVLKVRTQHLHAVVHGLVDDPCKGVVVHAAVDLVCSRPIGQNTQRALQPYCVCT